MIHDCPICHRQLKQEHKIKFVDYHCYPPATDHHYSKRTQVDGEVLICKIRLGSSKESKVYLKIVYQEGYSEVWSGSNTENPDERVRINQIIVPNFDDPEKLKTKILTYLLFS